MDKQNNIKTPGFWDCLMPGGVLLLSYMLLFYLPEEFGWKGWLIIGISAFLFCIGYFGLLSSLPEPGTPAGALARRLALVTFGVALFAGGIYYVYSSDGSEKSIAIATLALIESLVICGLGGSEDSNNPSQNSILRKYYLLLIVGLAAAGCWFCYREFVSEEAGSRGYIEAATMLWITAGTLWVSRKSTQTVPVVC